MVAQPVLCLPVVRNCVRLRFQGPRCRPGPMRGVETYFRQRIIDNTGRLCCRGSGKPQSLTCQYGKANGPRRRRPWRLGALLAFHHPFVPNLMFLSCLSVPQSASAESELPLLPVSMMASAPSTDRLRTDDYRADGLRRQFAALGS